MKRDLSRRDLLKVIAALAGSAGIWRVSGLLSASKALPAASNDTTPESVSSFLPLIHGKPGEIPTATNTPSPPGSRVAHVHSSSATSWTGQTDYWNYVDQNVVNTMVDHGLMTLTGAQSVTAAWQTLLPDYQAGQGIAIKVNLNNSQSCNNTSGTIDALIQPVNAIVRGLLQIGVLESDIWVYDAIRSMPNRFVNGSIYSNVQFFDRDCENRAGFSSKDPHASVSFSPPPGITPPQDAKITDALVNADYLINMPIMKRHPIAGASLSFKNHFGTIRDPDWLHDYIDLDGASYRSDYSPYIELYQSPNIMGKTVLTIGDGLFAAKFFNQAPVLWDSFGNQVPNSLFFSTDCVALDSIMCDLLDIEFGVPAGTDDCLHLAGDAGLGVFERGDPWGSGYSQIDYVRSDL